MLQRAVEQGRPNGPPGPGLGGGPGKPQDKQLHVQSVAVMVVLPHAMFCAVCLVTALAPPSSPARAAAWAVAAGCLAFALLLLQVYWYSKTPIYKFLGMLGVIAVCLGFWCGTTIYDRTTLQYWMNHSRVTFNDVLPSKPAMSYLNAAAITFAPGTRVDLGRPFGYRGAEAQGTVYCVAPIMDDAAAAVNEVRFWAVGEDCCAPTWAFACGAAEQPGARSGMVIRKLTGSRSATTRFEQYKLAAKQAAAMYHMRTPEEPIFLRWTQDAASEVSQGFSLAVLWVVVLSLLYLMLSIFLAGFLHWRTGRVRQDWQRATPGLGGFGSFGGMA